MMHDALSTAIQAFDIDRLVIACKVGNRSRDEPLAASAHMRLVNASADKDNSNGPELLRGLMALDGAFGPPDMDDKGLLLLLLTKGDAQCLGWAKRHGLSMGKVHMHNYIDHLLTRVGQVDMGAECSWIVERSIQEEFHGILLATAFLRGDSQEALTQLHQQLGGTAIKGELGRQVARVLYRDMGSMQPNEEAIRQPSDSGCAWFLATSSTQAITRGAASIMMDEENEELLIKPLVKRIPQGAARHEAHLIDQATALVAKRGGSGPRL